MNKHIWRIIGKLAAIGVIAGSVLAALLGIIQQLTNKKVYELLVNVDYIPVIKDCQVGPVMGFLFHIIVSICIVFALYFILANWQLQRQITIYLLANTFGGALLFH
jgi:type III secretory pathway component EscU